MPVAATHNRAATAAAEPPETERPEPGSDTPVLDPEALEQLNASKRQAFQEGLANILLDLQEKDGSWWDYPLYDYHQPYGTGYALMTLCPKGK